MALEQIKEEWSGAESKELTQTRIPVKEDILLPDGKPDMARVLQTELSPCIEESTLENGRLLVRGKLWVDILYLAEGASWTVHSMRTSVALEASLPTDQSEDTVSPVCTFQSNVEDMRVILRSGRKLNLSAMLELSAEIVLHPAISMISQVQGEDDLQVLESVRSLSSNVAECHEKLIVKEELKIPDAMGNISELLWWDAFLCSKEVQLMTDQAMVRGELEISALYTTEESDTQVYCLQQRIPFSGMLDGLGIAPGMKCEMQMQPEKPSVRIGPDEDGELRVFDTETLCDCVLRVYEEKEQHFVQDLYMPSQRIECDRLQTVLNGPMRMETAAFRAENDVEIPENLPDPVQIFYTAAVPHVDDVMLEEGQLQVEGVLHAAVYYQASGENGGVCAFTAEVPFQYSVNLGESQDMNVRVHVLVQDASALWQGGHRIRISAQCQMEWIAASLQDVNVLQEARMEPMTSEEMAAIPSMALYIIQPGDTLWSVAKRFNTTPDQIMQYNDVSETEALPEGKCFVLIKA